MLFQIAERSIRSKVFAGFLKSSVIPDFISFKLANRHINNCDVYKKCKIRLLE